LRYTVDEETIARLQRNDPTLTSLRSATSFVDLPPAACICCSKSFLCDGGGAVVLVLLLLLGSCSCICFICSLASNDISDGDISALGAALAANTTLKKLE
jgi:hypothetical protein